MEKMSALLLWRIVYVLPCFAEMQSVFVDCIACDLCNRRKRHIPPK